MAKMELSDQNKNKIKCFTFPLEIVGEMWKSKTSKEESCQLYQKN